MSNFVLPPFPGLDIKRNRAPKVKWHCDESIGGREDRYTWWTSPRTQYTLFFNVLRSGVVGGATFDELQQFVTHFVRHFGGLDSFLMTDPEDASVTDHGFGVGDGSTTTFQLQRTLGGQVWDTLGGPWATSSKPRTNLLAQSNAIGTSPWASYVPSGSVSGNAALAPDGSGTATHAVTALASYLGQTVSVVPETQYTFSWWARNNGGASAQYAIYDNTHSAWIDSAYYSQRLSETVWTRVAMMFTVPAGCTSIFADVLRDSVNADLFLWGAQLEAAAATTQYIPTTTGAVVVNPGYWPALGGFEPVWDPAPGPTIFKDGVAQTLAQYTLSNTGGVTFGSAPAAGSVLSWTGGIYKRVRFDTEGLSLSRIVSGIWEGKGIQLVTVKP